MQNIFAQGMHQAGYADVLSMVRGCEKFLERHTGDVPDGGTDEDMAKYVINSAGMISNDLHYLDVGGNGTPSGTSTTEAQSIHILGYIYLYKATGNPHFLERAEYFWQSYFDVFYLGKGLPTTPQPFNCHWMVNSKQPFNSAYPLNYDYLPHSGFLGASMYVTNNELQVPAGSPSYGDQLQKVAFAFDVNDILVWDSIEGRVTKEDWSDGGKVYEVEWFINYKGQKLDPNGDRVDEIDYPIGDRGKIKLTGHTYKSEVGGPYLGFENFTGILKFNYCSANGDVIGRNQPFDPRPLWVPLQTGFEGNASDAEQWFGDGCYQLWEITGNQKYKTMYDCVVLTCKAYADIDRGQLYWRQDKYAQSPFSDGIGYSYTYPSTDHVRPIREAIDGTIRLDQTAAVGDEFGGYTTTWLEQQSVWYKTNMNSKFVFDMAASDPDSEFHFEFEQSKEKRDGAPVTKFRIPNNFTLATELGTYKLNIADAIEQGDYIMLDSSTFANVSGESFTREFGQIHDGRNDTYASISPAQYIFGGDTVETNWVGLYRWENVNPKSMMVRLRNFTGDNLPEHERFLRIQFTNPNNGRDTFTNIHHTKIGGNDVWKVLDWNSLNWFERDESDFVHPISPPNVIIDSFELVISKWDPSGGITGEWYPTTPYQFDIYCLNDIPGRFDINKHGEYPLLHSMSFVSNKKPYFSVGNCAMEDYAEDNLAYTPGMIPFSNNWNPQTERYDAWRGMPYMGYQYGWIWKDDPEYWHNVAAVLRDSQVAYKNEMGVGGPVMAAYVWNRWDNIGYGTPDTFVNQFWGDSKPWDGYQARAMLAGCRMYEVMIDDPAIYSQAVVDYCYEWVTYLANFAKANDGKFPDYFPISGAPENRYDFVGHIVGNYLTGACKLAVSGMEHPDLHYLIDALYKDIRRNYYVGPAGFHMNGCWSEWPEGGQFFGFWAGDIFKALGMYMIYVQKRGRP